MATKEEMIREFTSLFGLAIVTGEEGDILLLLAQAIAYSNEGNFEKAMEAFWTADAIAERRETEVLQ